MKIVGNIPNLYSDYKIEKKEKVGKSEEFQNIISSKAASADRVEISSAFKTDIFNNAEIEFLKRKFFTVDEKREEKIAKLKDSIKNGEYEVKEEELADAILRSSSEEMV